MPQLDLRAEPDIASEQADQWRSCHRFQIAEEFTNSRTRLRHAPRQDVIQPKNVTLKKTLEVFRRRRNPMDGKELAHEADISASSELELLQPVMRIELRSENFRERVHSSAAGMNQRAVNIKQNQT